MCCQIESMRSVIEASVEFRERLPRSAGDVLPRSRPKEIHHGGAGRKDHRNRFGDHELGRLRDGGERVQGYCQPGGKPPDAERRGIYRQGRDPGRRAGQTPGRHQPHKHGLLDQALHGPPPQRGRDRRKNGPLHDRRRTERLREGEGREQGIHPSRDLRVRAPQAERGGGGVPGPQGQPRGHHRAGLLQRRPAAGHERRRADRRPSGRADHQRTHRGGPRLRAGEEKRGKDLRLRPGGRDVRRFDPRSRRRDGRSALHQRRHAPRRRRLRRAAHQFHRRQVQE